MKNDGWWDIFVTSMWNNQWTADVVTINEEFKGALYDESQGITDVAVKLYAMAQIRAIALSDETFKPSDFRIVAAEGLGLAKRMLDALRSGDRKKIEMYGDIAPVQIEDYYNAYAVILAERTNIPEKRHESSLSEQAILQLLALGTPPSEAKRLTGKVLAEHQEFRKVSEVVQAAYTLYVLAAERERGNELEPQPDDLRNAIGYDALKYNDAISKEKW
jgi:hypothetical protein